MNEMRLTDRLTEMSSHFFLFRLFDNSVIVPEAVYLLALRPACTLYGSLASLTSLQRLMVAYGGGFEV